MSNKLTVFVGPMFATKTSKLIEYIDRSTYQNKKVVVFKPAIDNRYEEDFVVSHNGKKVKAYNLKSGNDLLKYDLNDYDVVAFDEFFMIDDIGNILIDIFCDGKKYKNKEFVVSSIQLSASGHDFEEVKNILPYATNIQVCTSVCTVCHKEAYYTVPKIEKLDGDYGVGGAESYEPRCYEHSIYFQK